MTEKKPGRPKAEPRKAVSIRMPLPMLNEIKRRAGGQFHSVSSYSLLLIQKQLEAMKERGE